ncbi:response regulator [Helicobacter anatolicus]|uniref:response regulator n=1 Tax=Helicobacter anatolicus TaxID=2905874 RepID=UPI001E603F79|nr:response regulator [Helicobacter anatolicus]MCE3039022.1 response regulator [Helicobacter anatolicus]
MEQYKKLKDLTILYVEDDADTQRLTSMILEDYVGRLILAKNGQDALKLFQSHNIDLILTDILMPKTNGIEFIRNVRSSEQNNNCPVIITTAHTEVPYLLDAISLHVDGYILKPIDVDELLSALQKAVLPKLQAVKLESQELLIRAISAFVGGKKIEIIKFLLDHCDKDNIYHGSYEDIIAKINVSKPTIVKTFKQLIDVGLLIKIKNKVYKIHPNIEIVDEES